jgi:hypothetical protein
VVVIGSSVGYFTRPPRHHPDEGTYAELLERGLRAHAIDAAVTNSSEWFMLVTELTRRIEPMVLAHSPHVVVLNFGLLECEPRLVPDRALRWLFSWRPRSGSVSTVFRRMLVHPFNRAYRAVSPRVIRRLPGVPSRVVAPRFEREVERVIELVWKERRGLVLVLGISPVGQNLERIVPGTSERAHEYNGILRAVAARAGGDVVFVDVEELVAEIGSAKAVPDGIHFSVDGHRVVGDALVELTLQWVRETGLVLELQ